MMKDLKFEEFIELVKKEAEKRYPEAKVEVNSVLKNNGLKLTGLVIMQGESGISPMIYLENYYEKYMKGGNAEHITDDILCVYEKYRTHAVNFRVIKGYEAVKDRIAFKLVNYEKNRDMLADMPYRKWHDMAVIYYILLDDENNNENSICSCIINNDIANMWGLTEEELYNISKINTPVILKASFRSMTDIMETFKDFSEDDDTADGISMYVLSNEEKINGAAVILYEGVLKQAADVIGADLLIIPSSIHETIIMKYDNIMQTDYVKDMVKEVNETLMQEEVLSDNVYRYIRSEDRTVIIE